MVCLIYLHVYVQGLVSITSHQEEIRQQVILLSDNNNVILFGSLSPCNGVCFNKFLKNLILKMQSLFFHVS